MVEVVAVMMAVEANWALITPLCMCWADLLDKATQSHFLVC